MEKAFNSWSQDQQTDWQLLDPNLTSAQFSLGPRVMFPSFGNMVSPPVYHEPRGWFDDLPSYHQGFVPMVNSIVKEAKEKLPEASPDGARETNGVQKKFLVFDQTGDQTTLMCSLGVKSSLTRYQFPSLNNPKPQFESHTIVCVDELVNKSDGDDSGSDMREDTEELNALLYSDDDYDEDDETSTGHSPSSMMGSREQKRKNESSEEEEVASSGGHLKRRKKEDAVCLKNTLEDTASSQNSRINCFGNGMFEEEYDSYASGDKKSSIEKMKETINLLHNLIPDDTNGNNAIMVIDEAIHYLTNLKEKAKALGLDSF